MMRTRILVGTLILIGLAALFWLDLYWSGYCLCLAGMAMTGVALYELYAMARKAGLKPFHWIGVGFGAALLPYYLWIEVVERMLDTRAAVALVAAPLLALILVLMARAVRRPEGLVPQLSNMAVTVFGVLYVALPMALLVRTRFLTGHGWDLVLLVIAVAKASDVGGYFVGSAIGRHKLAPRISPKKTVEGAAGGLALSVAAALVLGYALDIRPLIDHGIWATIAFGLVLGVASQAGDLTESLIKRSTQTKDSGALLPAFGGMLDLIDSFLVAAPVAYFMLSALSHAAAQAG